MGLDVLIAVTLDPDHRQDDHGSGLVRRFGATEPDDTTLVGEFYDVAHQPLASDCRPRTSDPRVSASCRLSVMQG
jgi:hypothetical protein